MTAAVRSEPRRRTRRRALLLVASVLVGLAIAEVALRLKRFGSVAYVRPDPVCGVWHTPNVTGRWSSEGSGGVEINSVGMRDREYPAAKTPGTFRIAMLGDSYVEAVQVDLDRSVSKVVEARLRRAHPGREVEVLNFGASGFGTGQEILALEHHVWAFSPDAVVLCFLTGNDVNDNLRELAYDDCRPFFRLVDGALRLDDTFHSSPRYAQLESRESLAALSNSVRLLQLARALRLRVTLDPGTEGDPGSRDPWFFEPSNFVALYAPPTDHRWVEGWAVTEALVVEIARRVQEHGARFFLVTLSNAIQVHPNEELRKAYERRFGISEWDYPDDRIEGLCHAKGIASLKLVQRLREQARRSGEPLHGFDGRGRGHWNERGHEIAGMEIAAWLEKELRLAR